LMAGKDDNIVKEFANEYKAQDYLWDNTFYTVQWN